MDWTQIIVIALTVLFGGVVVTVIQNGKARDLRNKSRSTNLFNEAEDYGLDTDIAD